jgi:hypothetical protein
MSTFDPFHFTLRIKEKETRLTLHERDDECSQKFDPSKSVIVLFVSIVVSMEINRRHYFRSGLGIYDRHLDKLVPALQEELRCWRVVKVEHSSSSRR